MSSPSKTTLPALGVHPSADQTDERRLARPVRADDRSDLPRRQVEVDVSTARRPPNSRDRLRVESSVMAAMAAISPALSRARRCGKNRTSSDEKDADDQQIGGRVLAGEVDQIGHRQRADERAGDRSRAAEQRPQQRKDGILDRGEGRADIGEEQRVGRAGRRSQRSGKRQREELVAKACRSRASSLDPRSRGSRRARARMASAPGSRSPRRRRGEQQQSEIVAKGRVERSTAAPNRAKWRTASGTVKPSSPRVYVAEIEDQQEEGLGEHHCDDHERHAAGAQRDEPDEERQHRAAR